VSVILPFVCPICGAKSYNSRDAEERYCGRCHRFVDEPLPPLSDMPAGRLATVEALMNVPVVDEHGNETGETTSLISPETARSLLDGSER
jgi:hypothetical protein